MEGICKHPKGKGSQQRVERGGGEKRKDRKERKEGTEIEKRGGGGGGGGGLRREKANAAYTQEEIECAPAATNATRSGKEGRKEQQW